MNENEQAQRFRKWQEARVQGYRKRLFDECNYDEIGSSKACEDNKTVINLTPFKIFRRNSLIEGKSEPEILQEFKNLVGNPHVNCVFERGEWLVPEWQGRISSVGVEAISSATVSRESQVASQGELQALNLAGSHMVVNQLEAMEQANAQHVPAPMDITPQLTARVEDQPAKQRASMMVFSAVNREVTGRAHFPLKQKINR